MVLEPESGLWFLESPFRSPLPVQGPREPLLLEKVPLGEHLLLSVSGGAVLFLYVEPEELYILPR